MGGCNRGEMYVCMYGGGGDNVLWDERGYEDMGT